VLVYAGSPEGQAWQCHYRNEDINPHTILATALCLALPAE
jgi:hypothetical protein